jgi:hypothetical protein
MTDAEYTLNRAHAYRAEAARLMQMARWARKNGKSAALVGMNVAQALADSRTANRYRRNLTQA